MLKGVSATFETGKVNLIIGQSGSGKTVLMKSLVGLVRPEHGEILYDGRDLMTMGREQLRHLRTEIGMLFRGLGAVRLGNSARQCRVPAYDVYRNEPGRATRARTLLP